MRWPAAFIKAQPPPEPDECPLVESLGARNGGDTCDGHNYFTSLLPRGLRVRTNLAARTFRRTFSKSVFEGHPGFAGLILCAHLVAFPVATIGMQLIDPPAVVAGRAMRESNSDTFEAIWGLVEQMHYKNHPDSHALWGDELVGLLEAEDYVRSTFRSEHAFRGMTQGLLAALRDPYSSYTSESELSLQPVSQQFGLTVQHEQQTHKTQFPQLPRLVISGIMPDSPAERAGLRMGDVVLELGDIDAPAATLPIERLKSVLRGSPSSSTLSMRYQRVEGESKSTSSSSNQPSAPTWVTLHAAAASSSAELLGDAAAAAAAPHPVPLFTTPPVVRSSLLRNGVGYVRINQFTEAGTEQLINEARKLQGLGASGWVVDLRNNPGGQLTEAMTQASMIVPKGEATLAYTVDAAGDEQAHTAGSRRLAHLATPEEVVASVGTPRASDVDEIAAAGRPATTTTTTTSPSSSSSSSVLMEGPIVVLVDRGTASAAELFAAALRDNGRGSLVGEHTYGKGLIQRLFPMPNGGVLKLTIGEYLTPNHERVEPHVGLMPDVTCDKRAMQGEEDVCLERAARMARSPNAMQLSRALSQVQPTAGALGAPARPNVVTGALRSFVPRL